MFFYFLRSLFGRNEIQNFITNKKQVLTAQEKNIQKFLSVFHGYDIEIGNMYSTHNGEEEYSKAASMIAHGTFKLRKEYKNTKLLCDKLSKSWKENVENITASFYHYNVKGTEVSFQIWIKSI